MRHFSYRWRFRRETLAALCPRYLRLFTENQSWTGPFPRSDSRRCISRYPFSSGGSSFRRLRRLMLFGCPFAARDIFHVSPPYSDKSSPKRNKPPVWPLTLSWWQGGAPQLPTRCEAYAVTPPGKCASHPGRTQDRAASEE